MTTFGDYRLVVGLELTALFVEWSNADRNKSRRHRETTSELKHTKYWPRNLVIRIFRSNNYVYKKNMYWMPLLEILPSIDLKIALQISLKTLLTSTN